MFVYFPLVVLAVVSLGCSGADDVPVDAPPTVLMALDLAKVERGPVAPGPRVAGTLEAVHRAVLRTEVPGTVVALHADLGDSVTKGALLIEIENGGVMGSATSAAGAVLAAERDVANMGRDVERSRRLLAAGGLSQRDVDLAEAGLAAAEARLQNARGGAAAAGDALAGARVHAPIQGVVASRSVNVGDVVAPGLPLLTLVDPGSLRIEAAVPAVDAGNVHVGDDVLFHVQGQTRVFTGRVERKAPAVDPVTRQVAVMVGVPNADGALLTGLYATGRVAGTLRDGLLVPVGAVTDESGVLSVLVVRDGHAERVTVTLGAHDVAGERVELTSGVEEGETILVGAALGVLPGSAVELRLGEG